MKELLLPIRDCDITQPFGVNWVNPGFYKSLGIPTDKHNGLDFLCVIGTPITASMTGTVTAVSKDRNAGLGVEISDSEHKSIYWHLDKVQVDLKKVVKAGEIIGLGGTTGHSTGPHLHFGLKEIKNGQTVNHNNGFLGAIDPSPYFAKRHGDKWNLPAVFNRYGRVKNWQAEWEMRFKNAWLHKQLIARGRHPLSLKDYELNALVYGHWSFDEVMCDGMYYLYKHLTKMEYRQGKRPFIA